MMQMKDDSFEVNQILKHTFEWKTLSVLTYQAIGSPTTPILRLGLFFGFFEPGCLFHW